MPQSHNIYKNIDVQFNKWDQLEYVIVAWLSCIKYISQVEYIISVLAKALE